MGINKILITGRLYRDIGNALKGKIEKEFLCIPDEEVTEEVLRWADAYVAFRPTKNFDFYNIKWVHALGAGVDSFLYERQWKEDVLLTRTICSFGKKISEYCLSYILAKLQRHKELESQQREGLWNPLAPISMAEQYIMILGTGAIGQELAKNLSCFGAKVVGVSSSGKEKQYFDKVIKLSNAKELLSKVNWLINTLPLTKDTEGIIDESLLGVMASAGFINVGRGKTLRLEALIKALDNKNLDTAVLDVFSIEPLPKDSLLWSNPQVIVTPHISAITGVDEAVDCFLKTLTSIENGTTTLNNIVDAVKGY